MRMGSGLCVQAVPAIGGPCGMAGISCFSEAIPPPPLCCWSRPPRLPASTPPRLHISSAARWCRALKH